MSNHKWQSWDKTPAYGELLYRRATGELEEMESSKSLANILKKYYSKGDKFCDVGCGVGHYLVSLRKNLDEKIDYIGVDSTKYYIKLAQKAFQNKEIFIHGDIFKLPFAKDSFEIVNCSNVILHLPPPPLKPLSELLRIAKKYVIIRTLISESNHIIKCAYSPSELGIKDLKEIDLIKGDDKMKYFEFFNMYTQEFLRQTIFRINKNFEVKFIKDADFKKFDNTQHAGRLYKTATKVISGKQIVGNLICDWQHIIIKK